jgi:hypothetical protein
MIAIIILICGLMVFSLLRLAYNPKRIYKVRYVRIGFCRSEHCTFIKARNIADIQQQLEKKHEPWDIDIISVECV